MLCPNCGKTLPEGSNFCPTCGSRLAFAKELPVQEVIRKTLIGRVEGVKNKDPKAVEALIHKDKYSKFDDWPPFDLQGPEALRSEAQALKVLKEYSYETRSWKIEVFGDSAIAAFRIRYRAEIRDLSFEIQSRVTAFLVKQGEEWKIVHEHWSRFPEPASDEKQRPRATNPQ
jgi:ketosteroid isomerase-like protein